MIHDPNYLPAGHELGLLSRMGAAPAESDASEAATAAKSGKSEPTKIIVLPLFCLYQKSSKHARIICHLRLLWAAIRGEKMAIFGGFNWVESGTLFWIEGKFSLETTKEKTHWAMFHPVFSSRSRAQANAGDTSDIALTEVVSDIRVYTCIYIYIRVYIYIYYRYIYSVPIYSKHILQLVQVQHTNEFESSQKFRREFLNHQLLILTMAFNRCWVWLQVWTQGVKLSFFLIVIHPSSAVRLDLSNKKTSDFFLGGLAKYAKWHRFTSHGNPLPNPTSKGSHSA